MLFDSIKKKVGTGAQKITIIDLRYTYQIGI